MYPMCRSDVCMKEPPQDIRPSTSGELGRYQNESTPHHSDRISPFVTYPTPTLPTCLYYTLHRDRYQHLLPNATDLPIYLPTYPPNYLYLDSGSMPYLYHHHLFTCTFCWHLSHGQPHVLGRSARLTCDKCFRGIMDLAVC
ncbi:hypothetical protein F4824DRAFT_68565 [Ustulina deusta]|nr:hypothetical protein F4824DRAFT_68565 [Ustulina deusta]